MNIPIRKFKMKNITIVDYNCGNLLSLKRGIEKVGFKCEISREANKILNHSRDFTWCRCIW